jgi:transposase
MKAYPQSLGARIVAAFDNEEGSVQQLAQRFAVSRRFIDGLLRRRRRTESFEARRGGPKPRLDKAALNTLHRWVKEKPQPTLREICERLYQQRGIELSVVRMVTGRALRVVSRLARGNPAITLDQLCQAVWKQCGINVSLATMSLTLQRLGMAKGQGRPVLNGPELKRVSYLAQKNPKRQ